MYSSVHRRHCPRIECFSSLDTCALSFFFSSLLDSHQCYYSTYTFKVSPSFSTMNALHPSCCVTYFSRPLPRWCRYVMSAKTCQKCSAADWTDDHRRCALTLTAKTSKKRGPVREGKKELPYEARTTTIAMMRERKRGENGEVLWSSVEAQATNNTHASEHTVLTSNRRRRCTDGETDHMFRFLSFSLVRARSRLCYLPQGRRDSSLTHRDIGLVQVFASINNRRERTSLTKDILLVRMKSARKDEEHKTKTNIPRLL